MKKTLKLGVVVCVILSGFLMVWAKTNKVEPMIELSSAEMTSAAQSQLYVSNCARCHGADGKGNTKLGQELGVTDLTSSGVKNMSTTRMKQIISKGDGDMPGFSKKLKATQIASLVRYVRGL